MTKYVPPSFDKARVRSGLLQAMGFGEPTRADDKATFYFTGRTQGTANADGDGVPFDPSVRPAVERKPKQTVSCAIEFLGRDDEAISHPEINASRIRITLLDEEYQKVKDFSYVVAGGEKYMRGFVEPPVALGSLDVWTVWATAEGER